MKRRDGFTLVELLVSMALIIFMMAILSQAFVAALGTFRNLKGQGDLAEKLRSTMQMLQGDLAANHFDGGRRLSDSNFWNNGPPSQGFFRIWQGSAGLLEGNDQDVLGSYRSVDHSLAFTIKRNGNDMGDFLSASTWGSGAGSANVLMRSIQNFGPPECRYQSTSGGAYNYQWAEVAWFLQPQMNPTLGMQDMTAIDPSYGLLAANTPVPLYTLYRRQRLLVPDNSLVTPNTIPPGGIPNAQANYYLEMSCWPNGANLYFNNPNDITVPWQRFGMVPLSTFPEGLLYGNTTPGATAAQWPSFTSPLTPVLPWTLPSATAPYPQTYPPLPGVPPLVPFPLYPTLTQQGAPLTLQGADIQLNDVVSFDVRVYAQGITAGNDPFVTLLTPANPALPANPLTNPPLFLSYGSKVPQIQATFPGQANNPAFNMLTGPMVFDTWTNLNQGLSNYSASWNTPSSWDIIGNKEIPNPMAIPMWNGLSGPRILAIQITIRIWDFKTNQSRQVTIVQAM